jgi:hypothetical protein
MLGAGDQQTLQLWSTDGPRGVIAQRDDWARYARFAGQGNCEVRGQQLEPREKGGIAAHLGISFVQEAEDVNPYYVLSVRFIGLPLPGLS